jgi:hypothetical protein
MKRLLLGFDILAAPKLATWVDEHTTNRDIFFVNPKVLWPISVDRLTCPSIFQPAFQSAGDSKLVITRFPNDATRLLADQRVTTAITSHEADWPESAVNILGLWTDLREMLHWMEERPGLRDLTRFAIAIQVNLDESTESDPLWDTISRNGSQPALTTSEWIHLGFDVANRDQTSALSGSEFTPEEMRDARLRWGEHINQSGLLSSMESARAFREFSDARVPDLLPFFVYELSKLKSTGQG